jgi:hypothetical protein
LAWQIGDSYYYLGRRDRQVKIRGFRIELGEIEYLLKKHVATCDFIVLFVQDKLIAFYKGDSNTLNPDQFRGILADYAIPSSFVYVSEFPLNQSGKIDERALLAKSNTLVQPQVDSNHLSAIYQEFLGASIDLNRSFLQNGGDSISAIRVINKLKQHQLTLTVKDLFEPTPLAQLHVSELETRIKEENSLTTFQKSIQNNDPSLLYVPLIEAQKGILFDCLKAENNSMYVEQLSYEIPSTYTFDEIKNAYTEVAKNNPILKSTLARYNNHYYLKISNETQIECTQYRNESFEKIKAIDHQKGLDLEKIFQD